MRGSHCLVGCTHIKQQKKQKKHPWQDKGRTTAFPEICLKTKTITKQNIKQQCEVRGVEGMWGASRATAAPPCPAPAPLHACPHREPRAGARPPVHMHTQTSLLPGQGRPEDRGGLLRGACQGEACPRWGAHGSCPCCRGRAVPSSPLPPPRALPPPLWPGPGPGCREPGHTESPSASVRGLGHVSP